MNVTEPKFFKEVRRAAEARVSPTWKAYLRWHLVHANAPYLSSAFVQPTSISSANICAASPELQPRWKRCVQLVDRDLGEALGQVFVEKTSAPTMKQTR